jgi:hypothetical protein
MFPNAWPANIVNLVREKYFINTCRMGGFQRAGMGKNKKVIEIPPPIILA